MKNKKYTANKKNGGNVPAVLDLRTKYVPIGCGNCIECRRQKSREWKTRLLEDIKTYKNGKFTTLTFSNESISNLTNLIKEDTKIMPCGYDLDNEIATKAIRLFLERWRKKYQRSLRHWLVTEIGHNGTENIHLHGIIWTDHPLKEVEQIWGYGYMWKGKETSGKIVNYVNDQTINYIVKYITKKDEKHKNYKSKILTSPGIGNNYTKQPKGDWNKNKYNEIETNETYRTRAGHKIALPIYWRNKIYTEEEREKLWIEKINKQERWILGTKIDISKGEEEYYKSLKPAQQLNTKLGYGSDQNNWTEEQYERERRIIMQQTRIMKAQQKRTPPAG